MCLAGETCSSVESVPLWARSDESTCLRIANKLRELLRSCWAPGEDIQRPIAPAYRQPEGWDIRLAREAPSCGAAASPATPPAGATPGPGHSQTPRRPECTMIAWRWRAVHPRGLGAAPARMCSYCGLVDVVNRFPRPLFAARWRWFESGNCTIRAWRLAYEARPRRRLLGGWVDDASPAVGGLDGAALSAYGRMVSSTSGRADAGAGEGRWQSPSVLEVWPPCLAAEGHRPAPWTKGRVRGRGVVIEIANGCGCRRVGWRG